MKRIAIINQRYGKEVIGGSEYYTMLLANQLKKQYDVEILTSKSLTYDTWANDYPGDEVIDGITVKRFAVTGNRYLLVRKILRNLIVRLHWKGHLLEKMWIRVIGPYVPEMVSYLEEHALDYDAFIFVTYLYYPTVVGMTKVMERSLFIPTAHEEPYINLTVYKNLFQQCHSIGYLTVEEKQMVERKFHNSKVLNDVIGAGIEVPSVVWEQAFREKYHLEERYFLYVGRIEAMKGCKEMFESYLSLHLADQGIRLVVIGKDYMKVPKEKGILYLGKVSEEEKYQAMKGATALWLPSPNESLSLVVLEAMGVGTPVLVNGMCEVLEGHCKRSSAGYAYHSYQELETAVGKLLKDDLSTMQLNARNYVQDNYTWQAVLRRIDHLLT